MINRNWKQFLLLVLISWKTEQLDCSPISRQAVSAEVESQSASSVNIEENSPAAITSEADPARMRKSDSGNGNTGSSGKFKVDGNLFIAVGLFSIVATLCSIYLATRLHQISKPKETMDFATMAKPITLEQSIMAKPMSMETSTGMFMPSMVEIGVQSLQPYSVDVALQMTPLTMDSFTQMAGPDVRNLNQCHPFGIGTEILGQRKARLEHFMERKKIEKHVAETTKGLRTMNGILKELDRYRLQDKLSKLEKEIREEERQFPALKIISNAVLYDE